MLVASIELKRSLIMKKLALLLILVALPVAGCIRSEHRGNGKREVQNRKVFPFTSISVEGSFNVELVAQQEVSFQIEGDENILPLITSDVSGGVLTLRSTDRYSASEPIVVKISVPNLDALSVSGAGKFEIKGLKNENFTIQANGAPQINVSGVTRDLNIDTNGAANIDTHNLTASRGVVESKGVSNVEVDVKDKLDVTISGPSTVTYGGDPTVNKTVNGPGKVVKRSSEGA
jgi:hypothetical protein